MSADVKTVNEKLPDLDERARRHANMAAIRSRDTKPELIVRRFLFGRGYRYRLNHPRLPGHPDIVLRKYRTVIFVNGCFWHGHEGCRHFRMPKTNVEFWSRKIARNRERDRQELERLGEMGWYCITVWECQLRPSSRELTLMSIDRALSSILLRNSAVRPYSMPDDRPASIAAEP